MMKEGFTFFFPQTQQDVFVVTKRTRRTKNLAKTIILACPLLFPYPEPEFIEHWIDFILPRLQAGTLTYKWYDALNRMDICIEGEGFGGRGGWEDENKVIIVEVP